MGVDAISKGLVDEAALRIDTYMKNEGDLRILNYKKGFLFFLKGKFGECYEILNQELSKQPEGLISPHYSPVLYVLSVILGVKSLLENHLRKLEILSESTVFDLKIIEIASSILRHGEESDENTFNNIILCWPSNIKNIKNATTVSLSELQSRFNIDFKKNIEKHRMVLQSWGEE